MAISPAGKFAYPVGKEGAERLGYDGDLIGRAPSRILETFCGVGNPFSLGIIPRGSRVLDFGSGAGFDVYIAASLVGETGWVCGIDPTEEMVVRARENLSLAKVANAEIQQMNADAIPYRDNFFDVVISNGVINLTQSKAATFQEIVRVLKPGGILQFADVVLEQELPASLAGSAEAWAQ